MNLTSFATYQPRDEGGRFIQARVDAAVLQAVTEWANRVYETSQELVAVDTGELKASGHVEVAQIRNGAVAAVVYDAEHSAFLEFGTGQRGAASAGAGDGPYGSTPGMAAQAFLRPAFDAHRNEAAPMTKALVTASLS